MKSIIDSWVRDFAKKNNIYVFDQTEFPTCSDIDKRAILLNTETIAESEQGFAIAHEIGHIFHNDFMDSGVLGAVMENNADYYAVDLIYEHLKKIYGAFSSVAEFLKVSGIPTKYFNMATVVSDPKLMAVMLLYPRKSNEMWMLDKVKPVAI